MRTPVIAFVPLRPAVASDEVTALDLLVKVIPPAPVDEPVRPTLNLGLVIDRSGSMTGRKLDYARRAACHAVRQLLPSDRVAVTVFDTEVQTAVPSTMVAHPEAIAHIIERLEAGNSTALHAGWVEGGMQVAAHLNPAHLNRIMLLSDGLANVGQTNPDAISSDVHQLSRRGIGTTTMGVGEDYDEDLLEAMARSGDGNFYHIESPDQIPGMFATELRGLAATLGAKVSLGIEPATGITLKDVLNDLDKTEKGRLKLPNLVLGWPIQIALRLKIPPQSQESDLCAFRLAWDDPEQRTRQEMRETLRLPVMSAAQMQELPASTEVEEQFALLMAARARGEATRLADRQDYVGARQVLAETRRMYDTLPCTPAVAGDMAALEDLSRDLEADRVSSFRKKAVYQTHSRRRSKG